MQIVLLPHLPSVVTCWPPVGAGPLLEVDVGGTSLVADAEVVVSPTLVLVLVLMGALLLLLVPVGGAEVLGIAEEDVRGHPQLPYSGWQLKSGLQ